MAELSERLEPNAKYQLSLWVGNRRADVDGRPLKLDYTVELAAGGSTLISEKIPRGRKKGSLPRPH